MESVNETFEKVIEFLSIIQIISEGRRSQVEQFSLKYYATYLKDRKEELKKSKEKESQNNCEPKNVGKEEGKAGSLEIDGLEELALADSLLQKAQIIRSQSKVSSQLLAVFTTTSSESLLQNNKNTPLAMKKTVKDASSKNHAALPRCNSAPNAITPKLSRGLQSKSVNDCTSKNEAFLSSTVSNSRKFPIAQTSTRQKNKTALNSNVGYISSKTYKDLKCITVNSNSLNKHKGKDEKCIKTVTDSSDSSQNRHHLYPLTYQSFKKDLTNRCCLESHFQLPSSGFWYPFISFKNRESLIGWSISNSVENFITVVNLIFEIQETMMWIDFLTFLGEEIFPSLRLVKNRDKNVVRLCSYLSSIYHESLQRIPMLDFD